MGTIYGNRWEVLESLSEGGQAQTFLVTDKRGKGETCYVLKRLKNINRIERFKGEIEAIRNLTHENIVRLIDFDIEARKPYLVTEYCSGGSLRQAKPFWHKSPSKGLEIFEQICLGVESAHVNGIIHRDLKPDNIFLRNKEGPAVVGDFGICYFERDGTRITLTEEAVGSRLFMAPELEDGRIKDISPKSDIYSLGKILYWLLSEGKVFNREKHRLPEWDLKQKTIIFPNWNNIYMEHVNRLLDRMIVFKPKERIATHTILVESRKVARLVQKEFNPIAKDIPQPCTYCGYGHYVQRAKGQFEARKFGFEGIGGPDWRILTCNECGHVQAFRVDMAERKDWWVWE